MHLDLNDPNTRRRLIAAWHGEGCTTEHGIADCGAAAEITEDIDEFLVGLRRLGDRIDIGTLSEDALADAWHYGCRRIPGEHGFAACDPQMRSHILRDELPHVVRPMLVSAAF